MKAFKYQMIKYQTLDFIHQFIIFFPSIKK